MQTKKVKITLTAKIFAILLLPLLLVASIASAQESVYVKLKTSKLRSAPQFWASSLGDLQYGDRLTLVAPDGDWVKVKGPSGKLGYVHASVITDSKVILKTSGSGSNVSNDDVVLAGKGFNREVEQQFAASNPAINFGQVNAVERVRVSDQEVLKFLKAGGLNSNG
jgi:uncharacterized protein YgiM (DUF1202 family)